MVPPTLHHMYIHTYIQMTMFFFVFRAQMLMKARLKGAQKGHSLLKKKADALQMRFRQILGKIIEVSSLMDLHSSVIQG
jgi:hypothetical protein